HLPDRTKIKTDSLTAVYAGEKASLAVRLFEPNGTKLDVENGKIPYPVFSTRTPAVPPPQPAYLDFATTGRASSSQYLVGLVPAATEGAARSLIGQMTELAGENVKGIRTLRGGETDLVMFRVGSDSQIFRQGEWSADASVLTITSDANDLKMFAAQNARSVKRGNSIVFSSNAPASVAAKYASGRVDAVTNADAATRNTFFIGRAPSRLLIDGKEIGSAEFRFDRSANMITLNLPAGRHEIKIEFR
ncbi:MAG TPA: hypothetical protein VHL50_05135, partial [Pyrinomonadaceae bacterium]|nr:hypothetical protein [Pyrinomonadaceae bacterium]